jgi:hypothetical protein
VRKPAAASGRALGNSRSSTIIVTMTTAEDSHFDIAEFP